MRQHDGGRRRVVGVRSSAREVETRAAWGEARSGHTFIVARGWGGGGRWCILKGAIDGVHFCHEEGGNDGGKGRGSGGVTSPLGRRRDGWGGSRAWRCTGARARGGGGDGGGLLREGEGGAGVGQADREAKAQDEWRWLGRAGGLG
jgi:hypothetical protein